MAILLPGKFVFLATPHTGSTAIAQALKELPGAINVQDKAHGIGHHATLEEVRKTIGSKMTGSERVFAFVRNPYDLLVTWFLREKGRSRLKAVEGTLGRPALLADFIQAWASFRPKVYFENQRMFYHAVSAHEALRYERGLTKEINSLFRKLPGVPSIEIPIQNVTEGKDHWSLYYNAEAYSLANEAFKHDFVQYGYQFLWG